MALVYYCVRTLRLLKTNFATRAWTYISLGVVFFGIGPVILIIDAAGWRYYADDRRSLFGSRTKEELSQLGEQRPLLAELDLASQPTERLFYI